MELPMMKCGHRAQGTTMGTDLPVCVICVGISPGATEVDESPPNLEGRRARCSCGVNRPSTEHLAFFEYKGPGSRFDRPDLPGGAQFDDFYCGHAGWD